MTSASPTTTAPLTRKDIHLRRIEMRGCERSDGLYEIEGRLCDTKPFNFAPRFTRMFPANEPIHEMVVRLVFDQQMLIHEVEAATLNAPFAVCPEAARSLQALKGLCMARGWNREVRSRLSGVRSCTHLVELLGPMATTAIQAMAPVHLAGPDQLDDEGRPVMIDSCHAFAADGEMVRHRWPQFYRLAPDQEAPPPV